MIRVLSLVVLSTLLIASCGRMRHPVAPTVPTDDEAFASPEEVVLPGLPNDRPEPLKMMPGDVVQLTTVSAQTEKFPGLIVDARGDLHIPLAGDVNVGGKSLSVAEKAIETALRRYDKFVRANVILTNPAGHSATVLGAVVRPGRVVVLPGMRLADLLAEVGGPAFSDASRERTVIGDLDGARLMRSQKTVPVSIAQAIKGNPRHNVRIHAGDQLYVPPGNSNMIIVIGEVENPQPIQYRRGIRLTEALARTGGINTAGDRHDVRIVRGPLRKPKIYTASIANLMRGRATDVELAPGDIVYVTEHWVASTGQVLNALSPILSAGQTVGFLFLNDKVSN